LSAPVLHRQVGEGDWNTGRTVNVSRTGVLLTECSPVPQAAAEVEFVLVLPSLGRPGESRVQCQGRVVRHCDGPADKAPAVAVTIESYRFLGLASDAAPREFEANE
jgi:hypothetical protein